MENQAKARFIQRGQFYWNLKESPQGRIAMISAAAQWKRSGEGKQPGSLVNAVRSGQALSGDRICPSTRKGILGSGEQWEKKEKK